MGQNFGQIRSNVVKKVRKQALSLGFLNILTFRVKSSGSKTTSEWKFMAIIVENDKFKAC